MKEKDIEEQKETKEERRKRLREIREPFVGKRLPNGEYFDYDGIEISPMFQ